MRGWSVVAVPCLVLAACGAAGSDGTIDFGATEGGALGGSTGALEEGEDDGSSTGMADADDSILVPLSVSSEDVSGPCTALEDGERVLAIGSNAEAWLAVDTGEGTVIRTFGVRGERGFTVSTPSPVLAAVALDGDAGAFSTLDGLFTVQGPRVDLLAWPADPQSIVGLCGDLSVDGDGRVLADDVFTRDLGQWWRWNAPEGVSGPSAVMSMQPGACADRSGAGYVLQGETVWSVRSEFVESLPAFGPASAAVGHDAFGLATIVGGALHVGAPHGVPSMFSFEAGPATGLAADDDTLYVLVSGRVYAMRDGEFVELTSDGASLDADLLHGAGAGGVVLESPEGICFRGPQDPIELHGVRPASRRRVPDLDVTIIAETTALQATLDGAPVPLDVGPDGSKRFVTEGLEEGWHTFEVSHDGSRRVADFAVERLTPATWAEDIVPLVEEHCSGAGCHGPDAAPERPDLHTYATWVDLAETVRTRVAVTADMPPSGVTDWGVEDTLVVLGWLDAGLPGGE